ncbi:MAG: reverse transcriptase [Proteobacteria bacterium]|nr:reverse transcriptase [Candidatus Enterousia onthequi]MCQ2581157.1 reverse transcriptase [Alphaproteobacteria bacterium]
MRTVNHLWEQFISMENFQIAARKAIKSKKSKKAVAKFLKNKDVLLEKLRRDIMNGSFQTSPYVVKTIYEPKQRQIYVLPLYPDHILHHALINVLGPIWLKLFKRDSFACIPGRGLHAASTYAMQLVRRNKYVLQCDIRKFYPSIRHDVMKRILRRKISDRRILRILDNVVDSCGGDKNVPIGNLTSQWFGNVFLNQLDHFVKEKLQWHEYIRYCDDFCLFGNDKSELKRAFVKIQDFVHDELQLEFSKSVIYPVWRGFDFIGYRHFRGFVLLRKNTARRIKKNVLNMAKYLDLGEHSVGQLAAYHGWAKWANTYRYKRNIQRDVGQFGGKAAGFIKEKFFFDN